MTAMTKWMWLAAGTMAMAACQQGVPSTGAGDAPVAARSALPDALQEGSTASLYQRASQALAEQRMLSPRGDNAVEYYLAARAQASADGRAQAALVELQPYLLIAVEQALARGDATEADRLLALAVRTDERAPAMPRLKAALASLQAMQASEQAQRDAAAQVPAAKPLPSSADAPRATVATVSVPPGVTAVAGAPANTTPTVITPPMEPAPVPAESVRSPPAASAPSPVAARKPRLLADAAPRYPLPALRARVEGQAEVAFTIQPDGSVRDVRLVSSTPSGMFDASAVAVAQRWRFEATGEVHASRRTVQFRLPAEGSGGG